MTSNEANITNTIKTLKTFKVGCENQLIIQHALFVTPGTGVVDVTFDTAFAEPPNIICTVQGSNNNLVFVAAMFQVTATGFRCRVRKYPNVVGGVGGTWHNFYYRAIGKKVV